MKKTFLASIICMLSFLHVSAQQKAIALMKSNQFSINLDEKQKIEIFEKIKVLNKFEGDFSQVTIDDPEPMNVESEAYIIFDGENKKEYKWLSTYFKLDKKIEEGSVYYTMCTSNEKAASGSCSGSGCSSCKKIRNWFLGPVVGCDCNTVTVPGGHCDHSTGGGPDWWTVISFIIGFFL